MGTETVDLRSERDGETVANASNKLMRCLNHIIQAYKSWLYSNPHSATSDRKLRKNNGGISFLQCGNL